jgi:hypothetical protein
LDRINTKIRHNLYRRRQFLTTKSQIKLVLEGDLNTKFFHSIANNRYRKNIIHSIEINGQVTFEQVEIKTYIFNYYKLLLGTNETRRVTLNSNLWSNSDKLTEIEI